MCISYPYSNSPGCMEINFSVYQASYMFFRIADIIHGIMIRLDIANMLRPVKLYCPDVVLISMLYWSWFWVLYLLATNRT